MKTIAIGTCISCHFRSWMTTKFDKCVRNYGFHVPINYCVVTSNTLYLTTTNFGTNWFSVWKPLPINTRSDGGSHQSGRFKILVANLSTTIADFCFTIFYCRKSTRNKILFCSKSFFWCNYFFLCL